MPGITIVGLGPGSAACLTREAMETLAQAGEIHVRTRRHPVIDELPVPGVIHSFDEVYEREDEFGRVYEAIAGQVVELGRRPQGVVYAVPGHPCVGEATVSLIREKAAQAGLPVRLVAGLSFIEPVLQALSMDALPGLQIVDALELAARHHPSFHPDAPALIAQLYSASLASDVKLTLMNQYPDEHEVILIHAAGTAQEKVERLPLYEVDRSHEIAHLTALLVPPLPHGSAFESLQETVAHLRSPEGCAWDREQTHETLRAPLLEETYEVLSAIDSGSAAALREELGDLLLQVVLQSQIALEDGEFSIADVIAGIRAKLLRRHPHVFSGLEVNGLGEILQNWEVLKAAERQNGIKPDSGLLGSVPPTLPALAQSDTYQDRAARIGFDWPEIDGVRDKVLEEMGEVQAAATPQEIEHETGDLLFAVVNWCRWLKVDAEAALRKANARFASRLAHMQEAARAQGRELKSMKMDELEALWEAAKLAESKR
jgi:tetrapyrrole methylase family protein / MazG family protein